MLADLILNVLAPIAAKRYSVVRKALWLLLCMFLLAATYVNLSS